LRSLDDTEVADDPAQRIHIAVVFIKKRFAKIQLDALAYAAEGRGREKKEIPPSVFELALSIFRIVEWGRAVYRFDTRLNLLIVLARCVPRARVSGSRLLSHSSSPCDVVD